MSRLSRCVPIGKKRHAAGFEPTQSTETYLDAEVVTIWLGPVRMSLQGNHHELMSRCVPIGKEPSCSRFEPIQSKETDFDSVVVTTWSRPVRMRL
jgi:hypothetical protein